MSHPVYISRIRDSKRKLTHYSAKVSRYSFILFQETPCVQRAFTITLLHSKMGSKAKYITKNVTRPVRVDYTDTKESVLHESALNVRKETYTTLKANRDAFRQRDIP